MKRTTKPSNEAGARSLDEWIAWRAREDDRLYERYGKPLEPEHVGGFVAIGPDGQIFLGADELAMTREACRRFGAGNFALRRIGYDDDGYCFGTAW